MAEMQSPGLQFTEPPVGPPVINGTSTAVAAFIGIAERGPINKAVPIGSYDQFNRIFGGKVTGSYLRSSVQEFFDNGGTTAFIIRMGHYSDITNPATLDAVKATRQLTSGGSNAVLFEASSEGAHGNALSISTVKRNSQIATLSANSGTAAVTEFGLSDVRRAYVGAQLRITGAAAVAGSLVSSAGPFTIRPGEITRISIDQGADQVYTWNGTRGYKTGAGAANAGVAGQIVFRFNEDTSTDVTVTFAGTENSQLKALSTLNDQLRGGSAVDAAGEIKIQSDRYGTSSNARIVSGTGALLTDLGFAAGIGTAGTATLDKDGGGATSKTIAFLDAATAAEVVAAFGGGEALTGGTLTVTDTTKLKLQTSTTGASPNGVRVQPASTEVLGFATTESNGSASATVRFIVTRIDSALKKVFFASLTPAANIPQGTAVTLEELDVLFYRSGTFLERLNALAMNSAAENYFLSAINNNDPERQIYVHTDDALVASSTVDPRPDDTTNSALGGTTLGSDGTTPNDTDHIGDSTTSATAGGRGIYALDTIDEVNVFALPGRTSATVHAAQISYAERRTDLFTILDLPDGQTASQIKTYITATANLFSTYAACYHPWIKVTDPDTGALVSHPNSGAVLGVYARTDALRGVQKAPAGTPDGQLKNVLGVSGARPLSQSDRDLLYPACINFIIPITSRGINVWGSRTLGPATEFDQINVRRVFNFVKRSLNLGLKWAVFEPADETTRAKIRKAVGAFLVRQWKRGLLRGDKPEDAFYIVCDKTNNPPSVEVAGQIICRIGLAISKPAEFITFELVNDRRALDAELAAAGVA